MPAWIRHRLHRARIAFSLTSGVAAALSTAVFSCVLVAGASPHAATLLRLAISLPILYVGYSRYMLAPTLHADRAALGRGPAELYMLARVGFAIGAATGAKLAIEPLLVTLFAGSGNPELATIAPLIGDLGYGPLVTYLMLRSATPRRERAIIAPRYPRPCSTAS